MPQCPETRHKPVGKLTIYLIQYNRALILYIIIL